MKSFGVYYLVDPTDQRVRYVGYSRNPQKRYEAHVLQSLRCRTHKETWIYSLIKRSLVPTLSVRCIVHEADEAKRIEIALIAMLKQQGNDLTNGTVGGDGGATMTGKKFSVKTCAKIGAAHRGKRLSDEQRQQISEANRNRSLEVRAKMSASAKNRVHRPCSIETRMKISAKLKGRKMGGVTSHTAETRAKMSANKIGHLVSTSTRGKISIGKKGYRYGPFSPEHSANLSASLKNAWTRRRGAENKARQTF